MNEEFLDALQPKYRSPFLDLSNPFYVSPDKPVYIFIGFCEDVNKEWKDRDVKLTLEGIYNDLYEIYETLDMSQFVCKIHMVVRDELTNQVEYIKKGLMVQNDQYYPIQKSLHIIAKKVSNLDFDQLIDTLQAMSDHPEEPDGEETDSLT